MDLPCPIVRKTRAESEKIYPPRNGAWWLRHHGIKAKGRHWTLLVAAMEGYAAQQVEAAHPAVSLALDMLKDWHATAAGHHPDESCCDVTEAIWELSKAQPPAGPSEKSDTGPRAFLRSDSERSEHGKG